MPEPAQGVSRSSCHKMSSSVPYSSLVSEHFLNALMMIAGSIKSQAVLTHYGTIGSGGLFMLPAAVCSAILDMLLSTHSHDPCQWRESDVPACGPPVSFSVHLASSAVTPAGSVHKSRCDNVVRMWVQLKR